MAIRHKLSYLLEMIDKMEIPDFSGVILIGPTGCGKSIFARKNFSKYEILSADEFRGWATDDTESLTATPDAFYILEQLLRIRLKNRKLAVVDATNIRGEDRQKLIKIIKEYHALPIAVVFDIDEKEVWKNSITRTDRKLPRRIVKRQYETFQRGLRNIKYEGFNKIFRFRTLEEITKAEITKIKLWVDKRDWKGPFDIIGDIHGCYDEFLEMITKLGYVKKDKWMHPDGMRIIFIGDLVDKGPKILKTLKLAMELVNDGIAIGVAGNHEAKLLEWLEGKRITIREDMKKTIEEIDSLPEDERTIFKENLRKFILSFLSHYWLDEGKLVIAHGGIKEEYIGRSSREVKEFTLYGDPTGEFDEEGLPVRNDWAKDYQGMAMVVYGHTPVAVPELKHNTINIDTGCVYGQKLTALRYPEKEFVQVQAKEEYIPISKNFKALLEGTSEEDKITYTVLDSNKFTSKLVIKNRYGLPITITEEFTAAAFEFVNKYAIDPKWLIYLPPTMSPTESVSEKDAEKEYLEHPRKAIEYYRSKGIDTVVCEEKHMGSRAIIVMCKDQATSLKFFKDNQLGVCYTRQGRRFFTDNSINTEFISLVHKAITDSGFWEKFNTSWVCLDCEIMPWNAKAEKLLIEQYIPVAYSAFNDYTLLSEELLKSIERGLPLEEFRSEVTKKRELMSKYQKSYLNYCWNVKSLKDIKVAPFHLLATEGSNYFDKDHIWHLENLEPLATYIPFTKTNYLTVNLNDEKEIQKLIDWWTSLTEKGGEGMVIKPKTYLSSYKGKIIQPAIKCRGREYLRIIYGPEYTLPENLKRLRERNVTKKRGLALSEFMLGLESLSRFVEKNSVDQYHESAFAILAFESEPVDPRL